MQSIQRSSKCLVKPFIQFLPWLKITVHILQWKLNSLIEIQQVCQIFLYFSLLTKVLDFGCQLFFVCQIWRKDLNFYLPSQNFTQVWQTLLVSNSFIEQMISNKEVTLLLYDTSSTLLYFHTIPYFSSINVNPISL